jgi:putative ABC transport system permease protein
MSDATREPRGWKRYIRFFGARPDADVDDELAFHIEMRARDLTALGMSLEQARAEALRRFGDVERVRVECRRLERTRERRAARLRAFADLRQDVGYAARALVRQPAFTISAVLTLALGIAVNTAIFSAVNAYLIKPLAVRDPDNVIVIAQTVVGSDVAGSINYLNYVDMRERRDVFEDVVGFTGATVNFGVGRDRTRELVTVVSGNYFGTLGVRASRGRLFDEREAAQRTPVAVISDAFWDRKFDRDPNVIGKQVSFNGAPFTIIGVLPRSFIGTEPLIAPPLFVPLETQEQFEPGADLRYTRRDCCGMRVMARLKAGVTLESARTAMKTLAGELAQRYPAANKDMAFVMEREVRSRPEISISRVMPWIAGVFLALVSLVLLAACANVANLLLVRATARQGEIAVRRAIGASPGRLARQLLTESAMIGVVALGVAVALAYVIIGWLNSLPLSVEVPLNLGIALDWRVFSYASAIALGAGILAGLAPTILGTRLSLSDTLKEGGRGGSAGRGRGRLRNALVVAQVAVSLVLLVCAALFARSMGRAVQADLGFVPDRVYTAQTELDPLRYDSASVRLFHEQLLERTAALPGVERVALGNHIPFGGNNNTVDVFVDDRPPGADDGHYTPWFGRVSPGYFETLGFRMRSGRDFVRGDVAGAPPVAIINEALGETLWPGQDPLGKRLRLREDGPEATVVGVIANAKYLFLNEAPRPFLYIPVAQEMTRATTLFLRTSADPSSIASAVRTTFRQIDEEVVPFNMRSMPDHLRDGLAYFFVRIGATLAGAIGVLGLLQTLVGLYGVLSYAVVQRSREFGIRMALGAQAAHVVRSVMREGSILVSAGLVVGLVLAYSLTRLMGGLLIGISPSDVVAYAGSAALLVILALVSSYIPARRASRLVPTSALRSDG